MTTVITASGRVLRDRPEVAQRWAVAYMKGIRDRQPPQLGISDPERLYRPEHLAIFRSTSTCRSRCCAIRCPTPGTPI
jgi:hypothetical protein